MTQNTTPQYNGMSSILQPLIKLLVLYETEVAVRVWDGSQNSEDIFLHEVIQECRRLVYDVLIPDTDGLIIREFVISNYQKFYDQLPFEVLDIRPIGNGKATITYKL